MYHDIITNGEAHIMILLLSMVLQQNASRYNNYYYDTVTINGLIS